MLGFMHLCAPLVRWLVLRWCCAGALVLRWCCAGAALHDGRYSAFIVIGVTFLKATAFVSTITPKTQPPHWYRHTPSSTSSSPGYLLIAGAFLLLTPFAHFSSSSSSISAGNLNASYTARSSLGFRTSLFAGGISYKSVRLWDFVQVRPAAGFRPRPVVSGISYQPVRLWNFVRARSSLGIPWPSVGPFGCR